MSYARALWGGGSVGRSVAFNHGIRPQPGVQAPNHHLPPLIVSPSFSALRCSAAGCLYPYSPSSIRTGAQLSSICACPKTLTSPFQSMVCNTPLYPIFLNSFTHNCVARLFANICRPKAVSARHSWNPPFAKPQGILKFRSYSTLYKLFYYTPTYLPPLSVSPTTPVWPV